MEEEEDSTDFEEDWIKKYKETEEAYNIFYKSEINKVKIIFIYVDENNEVEYINKEVVECEGIDGCEGIDKNIIQKRKGIKNKKIKNIIENNKKEYQLTAVYKYNILYNPEDIIEENNDDEQFFTEVNLADGKDILFEKTIGFFQNLNTIYIIYKKNKTIMNKTIMNHNRTINRSKKIKNINKKYSRKTKNI
jgi:hypothetical protein